MEGKSWDHCQLAKADGTRAWRGVGGWSGEWGGASISHSVTPVHIALVRISMCVWHVCGNAILLWAIMMDQV